MCSLIECVLLKDLFTTQTTKGSLEGIFAVVPTQQIKETWRAFLHSLTLSTFIHASARPWQILRKVSKDYE